MSTMTDRRSVAANTRTTNILAGLPFEFIVHPSIVRVYMSAGAIGLNADVLIGGESLVSDSEMSSSNRFPVRPDDLLVEHGGLPGERVFIALRNTTSAVIVGQTLVDVIPL
jgi:hypothetical protein